MLGKGNKRNGTPVSKCISTGRELVCVGFGASLGCQKVERGFVFSIGVCKTPVIFCDTCDANDVLLSLGEEEEEFLFPVGGFYHKEKQLIFVCMWEEYDQVLKTLLHEFRHAMQHKRDILYVGSERYEERWIEKDARKFAERKLDEYKSRKLM